VNVQWLSDLVLGQMDALRLPVQMRYLQVGHVKDFYADLGRVWQWMSTFLFLLLHAYYVPESVCVCAMCLKTCVIVY
jgi:hypothetical protein